MKKFFLSFLLLHLLPFACYPQIPSVINYQGYLVDAQGKQITGQHTVTFNIYDNAFSNTPVWTEEHNVSILNGGLNLYLGSKKSFATSNLKFDKPYWLGIKVDGAAEFSKMQMASVPYSITSQNVLGKNAKEGYVLTWRDSTCKWEAGSGITFPFSQTISTNENGFLLKQTGNAPTMTLSRVYNTGKVEKEDGDSPQGIIENIAQFLSSKAGILSEINSDEEMIAGSFSTFHSDAQRNVKPTVYSYNENSGEAARFERAPTDDGEPVNTLYSINTGSGSAGSFMKDTEKDEVNDGPAVYVFSNGKAPCLRVQKAKSTKPKTAVQGPVAQFELFEKENESDAVKVNTTGKGRAGIFTINNVENISTALVGQSNGNGGSCISAYTEAENTLGGNFQVHNSNSTAYALQVLSNGKKPAMLLEVAGEGIGSAFVTKGGSNSDADDNHPTMYILNEGSGISRHCLNVDQMNSEAKCAQFASTSVENTRPCLSVLHFGKGNAIAAVNYDGSDVPALLAQKKNSNPKWAGMFEGDVWVKGTIEKTAGNFKIDHPLDPENKFLVHSFVESPEMKNIYDGIAVLDEKGEAIVIMPEWFDALNKDFRYQLTCVGGYSQVYIAEEMSGNQFKIAGGRPGLKVSWMVTGVRHDPYAEANPIVVEQQKKEPDKGRYIFPGLYNKPETQAIGYESSNTMLLKTNGNDMPFKVNSSVEEIDPAEFKSPDTTLLKPERVANNNENK